MIIITGASKGIGKYLFESYTKLDSEEVLGTYLTTRPGVESKYLKKLDICDYNAAQRFIDQLDTAGKKITLVNCAAITYNAFAHKSDQDLWSKVIQTNVIGTFNIIRSVLPVMRNNSFGRIINFSSVTAIKPTPGVSNYSSSKSALWGMSKSIAIENASHNITINNINLGYSKIGIIDQVPEKSLNGIIDEIPMKRLCDPDEILKTVSYLRDVSYITGSSIDLSGGLV